MKKKDLQPIILWKDEALIQQKRDQLNALLPLIQDVVDKFMIMQLPESEKLSLQNILLDARLLIDRHLKTKLPDDLNIPGLTLNKDKAISLGLIELPGRKAFEEALSLADDTSRSLAIEYFDIEGGTVKIDDEKFKKFERQNSIIAEGPEQIKLVELWQQTVDALEVFNDHIREQYSIMFRHKFDINLRKWFTIKGDDELIINYKLFRNLTRPHMSRVFVPSRTQQQPEQPEPLMDDQLLELDKKGIFPFSDVIVHND